MAKLLEAPNKSGLARFCIGIIVLISRLSQSSGCSSLLGSKKEMVIPADPENLSFENFDTRQWGRDETGVDFIDEYSQLNMDKELFLGTDEDAIIYRQTYTSLELVQRFIRNIKGFPLEKKDSTSIFNFWRTNQYNIFKPAWCFNQHLLKNLVKVELRIYKVLNRYYRQHESKVASFVTLKSYLADIEESSLKALLKTQTLANEDPYLYIASHPILLYQMIRRFVEDLNPILSELGSDNKEFTNSFNNVTNPDSLVFPNDTDLNDALQSLVRIQYGNLLDTFEMARGILAGVNTGFPLNALHALEVGAYHDKEENFDLSIQWFHFALDTAQKSPAVKKYPEILDFFKMMLVETVNKHNQQFPKMIKYRWNPGVFNTTVTLPFEPRSYVSRFQHLKPLASQERNLTHWNWAIKANFRRVCSGENLQTAVEIALLKCWFQASSHPYWVINPLKAEQLHINPPVFQFYEFIGEELMERMKHMAANRLERSMVNDGDTAIKVADSRTSSQTWLYDNRNEDFLKPLSRKMEFLSGLTVMPPSSSDAYQVAAYGPSHYYDTHIDSFESAERAKEKGNRITTIMGYLNDVPLGGRTGFPVLGMFAEPIKGSVVMWNNMKRNGVDRDVRTWHGGCPLILGTKWITNKWIYYKDNIFNFQCTLYPKE